MTENKVTLKDTSKFPPSASAEITGVEVSHLLLCLSVWLSCNVSPHYCKCPLTTPAINPYLSLCTRRNSKFDIFPSQKAHVVR